MIMQQKDMKIPSDLIPYCPKCGFPMTMNLRCDNTFVQDQGWYDAKSRYTSFIQQYADTAIVYLELGVGENTPGIIKYPFWQYTSQNKHAIYICINNQDIYCPQEILHQSRLIKDDIHKVICHSLAKGNHNESR